MKVINIVAAFAFAAIGSAVAETGVYQYVEQDGGKIMITVQCKFDDHAPCKCAIAGPGVVPSFDDAFM